MVDGTREGAERGSEAVVRELAPHPYQSLNAAGEVRSVNEAWLDFLGYDSEEVVGRWFGEFLVGDARDRFESRFSEFVDEGVIADVGYEVRHADGHTVVVTLDGRVEYGADGEFERTHCQLSDITERVRYEQRLEKQRDNLEVLNQVVRHDIRNDLQVVTAYADILADRIDDDESEQYLERLSDSADHAVELTRTARELADVMLTTEDTVERVPLRAALDEELADVRSANEEALVTVDGTIPGVAVRANELLNSVFRNLLKNAVQHTDEAVPEVSVSVTANDETVRVRVADNGPGVPDNQKETIFGKGEKGLGSEGTGLGLYLVRTLVDAYGGDVWVEDNDPEGAVFVVELAKAE